MWILWMAYTYLLCFKTKNMSMNLVRCNIPNIFTYVSLFLIPINTPNAFLVYNNYMSLGFLRHRWQTGRRAEGSLDGKTTAASLQSQVCCQLLNIFPSIETLLPSLNETTQVLRSSRPIQAEQWLSCSKKKQQWRFRITNLVTFLSNKV